jgi:hypothetical protein
MQTSTTATRAPTAEPALLAATWTMCALLGITSACVFGTMYRRRIGWLFVEFQAAARKVRGATAERGVAGRAGSPGTKACAHGLAYP